MSWTAVNPISIGDATKKVDFDKLWENADFLYTLLNDGTFTDHGLLVGSGSSPITALAEGASGSFLIPSTGADPSWVSGQLPFPATQNASSDANTLDDYEEGSYTLTITPATSGTVTLDSSFDILGYTKTGRVVHIQGLIIIDSVSSPVGDLRLSLPFVAASLSERGDFSAGTIASGDLNYNADYVTATVNEADTYFAIRGVTDNAAWNILEGPALAGGELIFIQLTYFTD